MPKRKVRKTLSNRSYNSQEPSVTFFSSKLFIALVAIALIVIAFAVISSVNNSTSPTTQDSYRIDTSNLKNDPSANQIMEQY